MLRLELLGFQLYDHIAAEFQVIEQEVDIKVIASDFHMYLAPNEGKTCPQLKQELSDVLYQRSLNLSLTGFLSYIQEVEQVRILEKLTSKISAWGL